LLQDTYGVEAKKGEKLPGGTFGGVTISGDQQDRLTRLPNNSVTKGYLDEVPNSHLIASIDGDNFKPVNDIHGHHEGDRVLTEVGGMLLKHFPTEFVGREGGEEFVIDFGDVKPGEEAEAVKRLNDFQNELSSSVKIGGTDAFTVSIGVARGRRQKADGTYQLNSDHASYEAKNNGRNQVVFYEKDVDGGDVFEYNKGRDVGRKEYVIKHDKQQLKAQVSRLVSSGEIDPAAERRILQELGGDEELPQSGLF